MNVKKRLNAIRLMEKLKRQPILAVQLGVQVKLEKKIKIFQKSDEIHFTYE